MARIYLSRSWVSCLSKKDEIGIRSAFEMFVMTINRQHRRFIGRQSVEWRTKARTSGQKNRRGAAGQKNFAASFPSDLHSAGWWVGPHSLKSSRCKWSAGMWGRAVRSFRPPRMRDRKRGPPFARIWHRPSAIYEQNRPSPCVGPPPEFDLTEISSPDQSNSRFVSSL